jgi:hypothetical protein
MGCDLGNIRAKAERQTSEKSVNEMKSVLDKQLSSPTRDIPSENYLKTLHLFFLHLSNH